MSDPRISPTILSQKTITASETVTANCNETGASAWGALTTEQKMSTLSRLLSKNLATAVPQLMQPGLRVSRPSAHRPAEATSSSHAKGRPRVTRGRPSFLRDA